MNERDKIMARLENVSLAMESRTTEEFENFKYRMSVLRDEIQDIKHDIKRTLKSE